MIEEKPEGVDDAWTRSTSRSGSTDRRASSFFGPSDKDKGKDDDAEKAKITFFRAPKTPKGGSQEQAGNAQDEHAGSSSPKSLSPLERRRRSSTSEGVRRTGEYLASPVERRNPDSPEVFSLERHSSDLALDKSVGAAAIPASTVRAESPPRSALGDKGNTGFDDDAIVRSENEFQVGVRVVHLNHGEGTVVVDRPDIHVRYDGGEVHHYSLRSASRKLKRMPIDVDFDSRPIGVGRNPEALFAALRDDCA
jgi:hypothetical protein